MTEIRHYLSISQYIIFLSIILYFNELIYV